MDMCIKKRVMVNVDEKPWNCYYFYKQAASSLK